MTTPLAVVGKRRVKLRVLVGKNRSLQPLPKLQLLLAPL